MEDFLLKDKLSFSLLFINGEDNHTLYTEQDKRTIEETLAFYTKRCNFIACADGGYFLAQALGLKVHIVLGDMDSLKEKGVENPSSLKIEYVKFDIKKDLTDTELALEYIRQKFSDPIIQVGGYAGRSDHWYALFYQYKKLYYPDIWFNGKEVVRLLKKGDFFIENKKGFRISLFCYDNKDIARIFSFGLEWQLATVQWHSNYSLSNIIADDKAILRIEEGQFLVFLQREIDKL